MQIEISLEFLSELIGTKNGDLSAAIKKDDENLKEPAEVQKIIKGRLKDKIEAVRKEARDEGHGRGKRESLTQIEKELSSKYEVSDDGGIEAVISRVIEKNSTNKPPEITPEIIKKSDVYVNDLKKEIEKRTKIQEDFESFKTGVESQNQRNEIVKHVSSLLPERKFNLPQSERVRERLLDAYVNEILESSQIEIADGKISAKQKDGQPYRDDMMNELSFDDYAASLAADFFEVQTGDGRGSPGAQTPPTDGSGEQHNFKSQSDFYNAYHSAKDISEKRAMKASFDKLVAAGKIEN